MSGALGVGLGFALLSAVSLAVQSLAVRVSTSDHRLSTVIGVVFAVNLLVLVPLAVVSAPSLTVVTPIALGAFVVAGVLGSLVARACYFYGIARLGASRAEPLKALFPVVAVGMAVLILNETVSGTLWVGIGLLVVGGGIVTIEGRESAVTATGRRFWLDLSFPLLAAVLLGVDPVITKIGLAEGVAALLGVTIRVVAAAAGFSLYLGWRALRGTIVVPASINRWLLIAGVANTGYLLTYYAALTHTSVAIVTAVMGISTVFVAVGAAVFLQRDERVTWRLIGAAIVVSIGLGFVVQS